jgi:hypothetical protein
MYSENNLCQYTIKIRPTSIFHRLILLPLRIYLTSAKVVIKAKVIYSKRLFCSSVDFQHQSIFHSEVIQHLTMYAIWVIFATLKWYGSMAIRGVSFEFRSREQNAKERERWHPYSLGVSVSGSVSGNPEPSSGFRSRERNAKERERWHP